MTSPQVKEITLLVAKGKTEDALNSLTEYLLTKGTEPAKRSILLYSRYSEIRKQQIDGLITPDALIVEINRLHKAILDLLLEPEPIVSSQIDRTSSNLIPLSEYLSYTCNRYRQDEKFREYVPLQARKNAHFYYLYGSKEQSHRGFLKRLQFELDGHHKSNSKGCIRLLSISPRLSANYNIYRENILKELFKELEIEVDSLQFLLNREVSILDKSITHLLDSPLLKGKNPPKVIFLYIKIAHLHWNRELCVRAARWFINTFCAPELGTNSPVFMFFFGVEFDENKPSIREEVEAAVEESAHMFALPELSKVSRDDVDAWFEDHDAFAEDERSEYWEALKDNLFGERPQFNMRFVEKKLKQLIDQYNNRQFSDQ